jgi:hypothetical protein
MKARERRVRGKATACLDASGLYPGCYYLPALNWPFLRALDRAAFFGARWRIALRPAGFPLSWPPSVATDRRSASMRLITLAGSRSRGASIFWPDCFFFSSSLSASS